MYAPGPRCSDPRYPFPRPHGELPLQPPQSSRCPGTWMRRGYRPQEAIHSAVHVHRTGTRPVLNDQAEGSEHARARNTPRGRKVWFAPRVPARKDVRARRPPRWPPAGPPGIGGLAKWLLPPPQRSQPDQCDAQADAQFHCPLPFAQPDHRFHPVSQSSCSLREQQSDIRRNRRAIFFRGVHQREPSCGVVKYRLRNRVPFPHPAMLYGAEATTWRASFRRWGFPARRLACP